MDVLVLFCFITHVNISQLPTQTTHVYLWPLGRSTGMVKGEAYSELDRTCTVLCTVYGASLAIYNKTHIKIFIQQLLQSTTTGNSDLNHQQSVSGFVLSVPS